MKTKIVVLLLFILFFAGCTPKNDKSKPATRPNILLIMLDDMGYSDLACYGGEVQTPNIDRLASEGIRFTQMHNCARCCPTRASLLTGHYPHEVGLSKNGQNLSMNAATIAEVLKANGYHTGMTGKWHLSETKAVDDKNEQLRWLAHRADYGTFGPLETYPCNRGFEEHWGDIWGVVNYFDPFSFVHNEEEIKEVPKDFYVTNFITQKSIDLIDEYSKDDKPFFLYVAHHAPHWPLHALPEDIAKYKDTYKEGWDVLREKRYKRMVEMGLIDKETYPVSENVSGLKWDDCEDKESEAACMATHAAMIDRVDQGVGEIIQKMKEKGMYDNTFIIVLSDNGASPERGYKPGFDRPGFTRDSTIMEINARNPGAENTWSFLGEAWAGAVNTPFRYWKKESYEGGCATPFIVHWPERLKAQGNTINRSVAHVIDIMPTCLELAGAKYPETINGEKTFPMPGKSLLPLLYNETSSIHDTLYWEHVGGRAIRIGDWKLSALKNHPWELFNMAEDHTETNDLSAQYPEKVKQMNEAWEKWAKKMKIKI